jgi:uncharacterized protein
MRRDAKSAEFFDTARKNQLVIKQCDHCALALPPEAAVCTACGQTSLAWTLASGTGTLVTWTVVHKAPNVAYTDLVPYTVGVVELVEGPWIYGRIDAATPTAGMELTVSFLHPDEGESYPVFS